MPARQTLPLPRPAVLTMAGVAFVAAALSCAARASDGHAAPAKPAPAAAPAKAAPPAEAGHGAAAAPAAVKMTTAPAADPIDRLQQRLAERLGAHTTPDSPSRYDVRISTRPQSEPAVAPPRPRVNVAALAASRQSPAQAAGHGLQPGAHGPAVHWSYTGETGPQAWADLKPEFAKCGTGTRQSPIDIRGGLPLELEPIQFEYRPTGFSVLDNGHTVQVNVPPGNSIQVQGRRFDLLQFHFHRPSEERIDGRQFDMVAHLVHKDPEGRLAVVAVLLDRGNAQPLVQTIWNNLPLEKGEELPARAVIDLNRLLPEDRRYYTYMGSLTTPPCDEGVLWLVLRQPMGISTEQIGVFSRLYPMNARPVQSAAGRLIKQSN